MYFTMHLFMSTSSFLSSELEFRIVPFISYVKVPDSVGAETGALDCWLRDCFPAEFLAGIATVLLQIGDVYSVPDSEFSVKLGRPGVGSIQAEVPDFQQYHYGSTFQGGDQTLPDIGKAFLKIDGFNFGVGIADEKPKC
jgi:hypothetical protein